MSIELKKILVLSRRSKEALINDLLIKFKFIIRFFNATYTIFSRNETNWFKYLLNYEVEYRFRFRIYFSRLITRIMPNMMINLQ